MGFTVLPWTTAKENKDDRLAQAVQNEASLSPATTKAGFSTAPRPQISNAHGSHSTTTATIRPPEVEEDCNHTRAALLGQPRGQVREGRDLLGKIPPLLTNAVCSCSRIDLLTSIVRQSLNILSARFFCRFQGRPEKVFKPSRVVSYYLEEQGSIFPLKPMQSIVVPALCTQQSRLRPLDNFGTGLLGTIGYVAFPTEVSTDVSRDIV